MRFVKRILSFVRGFFPSQLPVGLESFHKWADSIFDTYNIPNGSTYRHALASMIMHLGPTTHRKSKWFFVASIRKAQANEVAFDVIQTIKEEDQKKREEEAKAHAEVKEAEAQSANNVAH